MKAKQELTPAQKWERLTFADNFIFCKVMADNPEICRELLEILLNIKIERIEIPVSERTFKTDFDSRGVRFDVYVKDGTGRSFDIEIQTAHNTTLAKRARYYQGLMDVDNLQSGADYDNLKESYVIFLCLGDAFGQKFPVYTFHYICEEDKSIKMNDGTTNIFFNAKMYDKMKSDDLKSFFKYLCGKKPTSTFTDKLSSIVERAKHNAQWRHRYMTWEQELKYQAEIRAKDMAKDMAKDIAKNMAKDIAQDIAKNMAQDMAKGMAQNMAQGIAKDMAHNIAEQKNLETAHNFLEMGISPEQVSKGTGIPLEKVLELQAK